MATDFNIIRQYNFPTIIRFGAGAVQEVPAYMAAQKLGRPLIITDPTVAGLAFTKNLVSSLEKEGLSVDVFSSIHANPVKTDVLAGKAFFTENHRDSIIGLGGGAALDVARAVALSINNQRDLFDYDDLIGGDKLIDQPIPHFITIPTTSGTGSEVGRSAIIAEDDTKRKRILFHPSLMARTVFADPLLTMDLPPAITAATGMDALTHNLEALLAKGFHPMADGIALQGIQLIAENIYHAVHKPSLESRAGMMLASMMGAVAFQKGLGVVHSLAHPLSALLNTHHGLANALCLPFGMAYNYGVAAQKMQQAAAFFGKKIKDEGDTKAWLQQLNEQLHLPTNLGAIGVNESHLATLSTLALADFCHPANPRSVALEDFRKLYSEAL